MIKTFLLSRNKSINILIIFCVALLCRKKGDRKHVSWNIYALIYYICTFFYVRERINRKVKIMRLDKSRRSIRENWVGDFWWVLFVCACVCMRLYVFKWVWPKSFFLCDFFLLTYTCYYLHTKVKSNQEIFTNFYFFTFCILK